jgi:sodium-dependent dicarboxylate transporter 2/3/5
MAATQLTDLQTQRLPTDGGSSDEGPSGPGPIQRFGFVAGPLVFVVMLLLPAPGGLPDLGWKTAAVTLWMGLWWLSEAVPIPVTSLLPLVLFPTLGILSITDAAAPYANEVIFLFMGSFFLAKAMETWGVHRRIALAILERVGSSPSRLVLGFMAATAFISMWINNTSATTMMLPVAIAIGAMFKRDDHDEGKPYHFGIALMLAIAYASSIGGLGTLIGTAPNALFAASARELAGYEVGFVQWMLIGVPIVVVLVPLTWLILIRMHPPGELRGDADAIIESQVRAQGPMNKGEKFVAGVFAATVFAWIMRAPKEIGAVTIPGIGTWLPGITDSMIVVAAAVLLMVFPLEWRTRTVALEWRRAERIPWGVLLLFGGGLSLADAMQNTGLAEWIGGGVEALGGLPIFVLLLAVAALFIALTEVTSNTAVTAMAMPVMAGVAVSLGMEPAPLMATAAIACSTGFMLPAGTPPNAIVFSSGYLTVGQMARAGFLVNLLSVLVVAVVGTFLIPLVLTR